MGKPPPLYFSIKSFDHLLPLPSSPSPPLFLSSSVNMAAAGPSDPRKRKSRNAKDKPKPVKARKETEKQMIANLDRQAMEYVRPHLHSHFLLLSVDLGPSR